MKILDILRTLFRLILAGLFCVSILFWIGVSFYCVRGYVSAGADGVTDWLRHVTFRATMTEVIPTAPDWNAVTLRFIGIAVITLVLWLANRRLLKRLSGELRKYFRSLRHPPTELPKAPRQV